MTTPILASSPVRRIPSVGTSVVLLVVVLTPGARLAAQPTKGPTPEGVRELGARYKSEREAAEAVGVRGRFSPDWYARADALAKQAEEALAGNRLVEAHDLYRQARWSLPAPPAGLPDHVTRVFGDGRLRHSGPVFALALSPDGRRLATAGQDAVVKVWDLETGHEVCRYLGHEKEIRALAFSPDGKSVASGGGDKEVKLWDAATGKDLRPGRTPTGHKEALRSVAFSPDGRTLATGGLDRTVRLYEVGNPTPRHELAGHNSGVNAVVFSPRGNLLASVGGDHFVRVWDLEGNVKLGVQPYRGSIYAAAFLPSGDRLAVGGASPDVAKIVSASDGAEWKSFEVQPAEGRPTGQVTSLALSRDGATLATGHGGGPDHSIRLWDAASGRCFRTLPGHAEEVTGLAFTPDGGQLVSASKDGTAHVWELSGGGRGRDYPGSQGPVWSAQYSPDGKFVVAGGADRLVRVWDAATGREVHALAGHRAPVTWAGYSPDGKSILSCGGDKVLKLWDAETGKEVRTFPGHGAAVTAAAFSPDGKRFASASADHTVRVWDAAGGKDPLTIPAHQGVVTAVAWSGDGKQLASGGGDRAVRIWHPATGKGGQVFEGPQAAVCAVAFSPDGRRLAAGCGDHRVLVWKVDAAGPPTEFIGHSAVVSAVAFSPDGRLLASAGGDQMVRLWDAGKERFQEQQAFRGHKDWVTSVAFSPDGHFLLSAGVDRALKAWELGGGGVGRGQVPPGEVLAAAVSPDGRRLAAGNADGSLRVYDAANGKELAVLAGHTGRVTALTFLADSRTLVSAGDEKTVLKVWDTTAGKELRTLRDPAPANEVPVMVARPGGRQVVVWPPPFVETYDVADGKQLAAFDVNAQEKAEKGREVRCLAFSADGALAALGREDGVVRLWDVDARKERRQFPAHAEGLVDLTLTPDKKYLVTSDKNGQTKVWDLAKDPVKDGPLHVFTAHKQPLAGLAMAPDGGRFASVGQDNVVKVWELPGGKEVRQWDLRLPALPGRPFVRALAFTPDGKHVVTANADSTLYLLECP